MSRMKTKASAPMATNAVSVPMPYERMSVIMPLSGANDTRLGPQPLHDVEHLRGQAAGAGVVGGVADDAFLVDDEGGAALHAVLAAHLPLGIGQQRDRQAVAVAEIGVRQAVVG